MRTALRTALPAACRSRCAAIWSPCSGAERVLARAIDLIAYASDASPYRRLPAVVVMAHDANDVGKVLSYARKTGIPVNFRGGGTSLSGQAQTDGIMIDVRRWFSGVKIEDGGARARIKAGTLLGLANRLLARRGFKLGPDPASKDIATLGGVIANYRRGHDHMAAKTAAALWRWSDGATLPVVIDASSCAHGLREDLTPRLDGAERERFARARRRRPDPRPARRAVAWPAIAACCTPSCSPPRCATPPSTSPNTRSTSTSAATGPVRSPFSRSPAHRTSRS
jgi:hypothetical protein